eukprot:CAMPEP_0201283400 /NCGR_PEP_ID=MMETSP1317-20130820/8460_1 /ASSEMBLY_ACC=CAM_ASM_000770 /TAXON_ID=187299 /ORGANISM="Undescribed Undescribed, Strain Undescribed" /LENGTH=56 /DNA_ID=CAMNT_0047599523 /DNA_START=87 /DNA_END=257 /DNA_ORIENTATION=+
MADEKVKIEIELDQDQVVFRHSGKPFDLKDLMALLMLTSWEESEDPVKGKQNAKNT